MAETLSEGLIIPSPGDPIPDNGNEPTRLLGSTANTAIAGKLDVGDPSIASTARTVVETWQTLPSGTSPNTLTKTGWYRLLQSGTYPLDMPSWWEDGRPATIINYRDQFGWGHQEMTQTGFRPKRAWRMRMTSSTFSEWIDYVVDPPSPTSGVGGQARTTLEITGEYTNPAATQAYVDALAQHRAVHTWSIGQTVNGLNIPAVRIGDPSKPAVLVVAGIHGNELGCRDGAMVLARELAMNTNYLPLDVCMVVVPSLNLDGWDVGYGNANGVNINSDFIDKTQPETLAVVGLLDDPQFDFIAGIDVHNFGYIQQVSLRWPMESGAAHPDVQVQAEALYNAVWTGQEVAGHRVRDYEPAGNGGSLWRALAQQWALPSLLMEIPSYSVDGGAGPAAYENNPRMAEVARVLAGVNAFAQHVRVNAAAIIAARDAGLANPVPVVPIGD